MISREVSVFINRSIQDVWDYSADFARAGEWQAGVVRSEMYDPVGVGATGIFVQKFMGREIESDIEITAYDPPYQVCFRTLSGPISFAGCQNYQEENGGTWVTVAIEGEPGGFFKIAEGMVANQLEKSVQGDLENLKAIMEG